MTAVELVVQNVLAMMLALLCIEILMMIFEKLVSFAEDLFSHVKTKWLTIKLLKR